MVPIRRINQSALGDLADILDEFSPIGFFGLHRGKLASNAENLDFLLFGEQCVVPNELRVVGMPVLQRRRGQFSAPFAIAAALNVQDWEEHHLQALSVRVLDDFAYSVI